jgi:spermidine/putrescine transport system ATP-binding protein
MSDRIAVMHLGKVLQVGTPTEIYERPQCRFVADFIGDTNFLEGVVQEQDGEIVTVLVDGRLPVLAQSDQALVQGSTVSVAVRPEKIRLLPKPAEGACNSFLGEIEQVVYVGTDTRFRVRLSENITVDVREQNLLSTPDPTVYYEEGAENPVYAVWLCDAARILFE